MFTTQIISPIDLHLDERNPRFRIATNPSQKEIRSYMLEHEKVLNLANKMVNMNTILPGERIIICKDNGKNIVLEGNRRTCVYQMLLNRKLIPESHKNSFPKASKEFLSELKNISVDVVSSREEAMAFLAARHIEGVEKWSSVSKWHISYECFIEGKKIQEISEYLILPVNKIKTNICNYKVLLRGMQNSSWTPAEKEKLNFLDIKPDKLIRILRLSETTSKLGLYFDEKYNLKSNYISDDDLDLILKILTKKAFIDNSLNTRSNFNDLENDLEPFINKKNTNTGANINGSGGSRNVPYFFEGLRFGHLSPDDQDTHGVVRICREVQLISSKKFVETYPIASAFLTRALIEQSLIYYAKKNTIQGLSTIIFSKVEANGKIPKLSRIVDIYNRNLPNFIHDSTIREYFTLLFENYNDVANPLNWVIHRPHEFVVPANKLKELPSQGLLRVINYLISNN